MNRRQALKGMAGAAALAAVRSGHSQENPFTIPVPIPSAPPSSFRHSVCRWCYKDFLLDDLCHRVRRMGFASVELLDPPDWPTLKRHGLVCAMANGATTIPDGLNRLENHTVMVPGMIERIRLCAEAGVPNVICFSGYRRGMDDETGLRNCAIGVKKFIKEAELRGVTVCMELLNSKIDHKDYMCDHTVWGAELVRQVGSDRFRLLYDIYHMQIMEGDVIRTIRENHPYIGHYHTGGVPGRHEIDGTQELNYTAIARAIKDTGFTGFMAQEFVPVHDPMFSLAQALATCSV